MLESFLVLLSGGIMLAVALADPRDVTLNWLRLGGILALSFVALGLFFARAQPIPVRWTLLATAAGICAQLAFAQTARRDAQRVSALLSAGMAVVAGAMMIRPSLSLWTIAGCIGAAAMCGLTLMDMLLGHAYLTASRMTMAPFRRLNAALLIAIAARVVLSIFAVVLQQIHPAQMFWQRQGLLAGTRWLVGLLVPAAFVIMAHACIRRRATQSATGILYVAGVLIFIGEIIALQLLRETGLPL